MKSNEQAAMSPEMSPEEIREILISTSRGDWIVSDETGVYTYMQDDRLKIQMRPINYRSVANRFCEKWAAGSSDLDTDQAAYRVIYDVFYGDTFVVQKVLVEVDGARAILPMPRPGTNVIPYEEYLFARIVSPDSMEEYINRFGLMVELK